MQKRPVTSSCSIIASFKHCDCGGLWKRVPHQTLPINHPVCSECESTPKNYELRKVVKGKREEFRYNRHGCRIKSIEEAYKTSNHIDSAVASGTYSKLNYKKRRDGVCITDTITDFLEDHIYPRWKKLHMTMEDKMWIQDFLEPFMADVGVFILSEIHLAQFIRTFHLKGEDRARAERLFDVIRREIKL
jgi:hypothetical protein